MDFKEKIEAAAKAALMGRTVPEGESQGGFVLKTRLRIIELTKEQFPEVEINIQVSMGELLVLADESIHATSDGVVASFKIQEGGALQFLKCRKVPT